MNTIKNRIIDFNNAIIEKTRTDIDKTPFFCLKDKVKNRDEFQEIIRQIHDEYGMLPDDTVYKCIKEVLEYLTDCPEDSDLDEYLYEIEPPIYTYDLRTFAGSLIGYYRINEQMAINPCYDSFDALISHVIYEYYIYIGSFILNHPYIVD